MHNVKKGHPQTKFGALTPTPTPAAINLLGSGRESLGRRPTGRSRGCVGVRSPCPPSCASGASSSTMSRRRKVPVYEGRRAAQLKELLPKLREYLSMQLASAGKAGQRFPGQVRPRADRSDGGRHPGSRVRGGSAHSSEFGPWALRGFTL